MRVRSEPKTTLQLLPNRAFRPRRNSRGFRRCRYDFAGLRPSPLQLPRIPSQFKCILLAFRRAVPKSCSIVSNEHYAITEWNWPCAERASFWCVGHFEIFTWLILYLIFLASLSVSRSIRTSPILTGPFTFRVRILPLSRPSSNFTLTCVISPATPVLPTTWIISAGVTRSSVLALKLERRLILF